MNETEFEELYQKNARALWSYLVRMTGGSGGSASLADDFLQETFFRYFRSPLKAADDSAVRSYLFRIATNLVYDHFRRAQRESKWRFLWRSEAEQQRPGGGGDDGAAAAADPAARETLTQETEMMQVFRHLKPQERALLWLAYVEGYEHREIAAVLNLNSTSVRVLLFRARRKLANLLEGEKGERK